LKHSIILVGGGGHCKSVIDVIEAQQTYEITGIIDQPNLIGNMISGYKIIGSDSDLHEFSKSHANFLITVGQIKSSAVRKKIFEGLQNLKVNLPVVISPLGHVSKRTSIGEGTIVMHYAMINAEAKVGMNCIINSRALIEHDCNIGNHTQISTGAIVNGNVKVGDHCFIGSGAVLVQGIEIADYTIIAAGSVVTKSIVEKGTYAGVPAKPTNKK
jgi:sugar O-acyltransferase (sialic acid O-acetyltransferase NeuD family)